jgi:hypothetical protein
MTESEQYQARLEADRVTAAWKNRADRLQPGMEFSPLFAGEVIEVSEKTGKAVKEVERQGGLFNEA